jgi:hypothetical protein
MDIADPQRADNIHTLPVPNVGTMRQHLEHQFGGYLDGCHEGLIELAWTDPNPGSDGRYRLSRAQMFGTDQLDELVARAAELNIQQYCNVYIGAALRKPDTFPAARANAGDILALTCGYVDLDDEGAVAKARGIYGAVKPSLAVVTGRSPFTRAQCWWRLEEPITDQVESEALLKGMAAALGGDPSVTDPARVMRLAGSIAWPVKEGRQVEQTYIVPLREPGRPSYMVEELARLFPPCRPMVFNDDFVAEPDGITRAQTPLGFAGKVNDGRDLYLLRTIEAVLIQLIGESGLCPLQTDLVNAVWPQYSRNADLTKRGKGFDEVVKKCGYSIRRFQEGRINGLRDVREAKAIYARKKAKGGYARQAMPEPPKIDPQTGKPDPLILTSEQFIADFTPPAYLVDGIIQRGYLYSLTARTHHGKTAVAMFMAQCIARSEPMHGCTVTGGTVLILAGENPDDVRARFMVLAEFYGFDITTIKIRWIAGVRHLPSHMDQIRAEAETIDDLVLVIVDTAAAYFPGTDTNSNSEQGAYARLLRELTFLRGKPAAIVACHPTKNAARDNLLPMGGSAFLNEVDGNLTLWANAEKQTCLHWLGKFRGPEFNPLAFEIQVSSSPAVKDAEGRLMPAAVASPISETTLEAAEMVQESDENQLLQLMHKFPKVSFAELARRMGFVVDGQPSKWKVQRIIERLQEDRLVAKHRGGKYRLTEKGKGEIGMRNRDGTGDFG